MIYNLNQIDLVNLVCGVPGNYEIMSVLEGMGMKNLYTYYGGFEDRFKWNRGALFTLKDEALMRLYQKIKNL